MKNKVFFILALFLFFFIFPYKVLSAAPPPIWDGAYDPCPPGSNCSDPQPGNCAYSDTCPSCGTTNSECCSGATPWTKYKAECKLTNPFLGICGWAWVTDTFVCSTGDKCISGETGLRAGQCDCSYGGTYKTCCSGSTPVGCIAYYQQDPYYPPEGVCGGAQVVYCGGPGQPACGTAACQSLGPTPTPGASPTPGGPSPTPIGPTPQGCSPTNDCSDSCGACSKCDLNGVCQPDWSSCSSGSCDSNGNCGWCYCYCQENPTGTCDYPCNATEPTVTPPCGPCSAASPPVYGSADGSTWIQKTSEGQAIQYASGQDAYLGFDLFAPSYLRTVNVYLEQKSGGNWSNNDNLFRIGGGTDDNTNCCDRSDTAGCFTGGNNGIYSITKLSSLAIGWESCDTKKLRGLVGGSNGAGFPLQRFTDADPNNPADSNRVYLFKISSLPSGSYRLHVRATNFGGGCCGSATVDNYHYFTINPTAPNPPTNLTNTCSCATNQATISWDPSANTDYYALRVDAHSDDPLPTWSGSCEVPYTDDFCYNTSSTSYTFGITPGVSYNWWIHSINAGGWSASADGPDFSCTCATPTPTPSPTLTPSVTPTNSPWKKLSRGSFQSKNTSQLTNRIPLVITPYDADDSLTPYFIVNKPGTSREGGIISGKNTNIAPATQFSENDWSKNNYQSRFGFTRDTFLQYVTTRKNIKNLDDLGGLSAIATQGDGIYKISGAQTISDSSVFGTSKFVLIVEGANGDVTVSDADFNHAGNSLAILAHKITFNAGVTEATGIFIAPTIEAASGTNSLKIIGNLVASDSFLNNRDLTTVNQNRTPSIFIVFNPKIYFDLLPYLSISKYDWQQMQ